MVDSVEQRFWAKVEKGPNCWMWTGATCNYGYGKLRVGSQHEGTRTTVDAHRLSWHIHFGKIPDGMLVCHKCDNPPCVNPNHLFLGTASDNMRDKILKNRHGHSGLCAGDIIAIRNRAARGAVQERLAVEFGVAQSTISRIVRRVAWGHVS